MESGGTVSKGAPHQSLPTCLPGEQLQSRQGKSLQLLHDTVHKGATFNLTLSPASNVRWFSPTYHSSHPNLQLCLVEKALNANSFSLQANSGQHTGFSYPTMHHPYAGMKHGMSTASAQCTMLNNPVPVVPILNSSHGVDVKPQPRSRRLCRRHVLHQGCHPTPGRTIMAIKHDQKGRPQEVPHLASFARPYDDKEQKNIEAASLFNRSSMKYNMATRSRRSASIGRHSYGYCRGEVRRDFNLNQLHRVMA